VDLDLDDLTHCAQFTNCGVDGSGRDPNSVGVLITGLSNRNKWYGGFWSDKARALVVDSTALDHNTIAGVMMTAGNGRSVEVADGALILVGCDVYGQVYLADSADSVQLVGCDAKSATFAGQSPAALARLLVVGSRLAAGPGIARLSARGDGTVAVHRRSGTQGAQLRLNDAADAVSATLGLTGDDVVIETRVGGTVTERFRLAASGAVTLSGPLTLPADPTAATQAATKAYVDANAGGTNRVLRAGDTMTGALSLPGDPTANLHAATKGYVDTQFTARALPIIATATATALTAAAHNARMVIANIGTTLSADWAATGHGFSCMIVNRTAADLAVTLTNFSGAIANPDGHAKIQAGGIASLIAYSPDGGTTKVMHLAGSGAP
jgi:hypothetical protein